MYKWDPVIAAQMIEEEKISTFIAPAAMTGDLVLESATLPTRFKLAFFSGGGGAPRAPEQVRNIEKSFAKALPGTGWGMTETNAMAPVLAASII